MGVWNAPQTEELAKKLAKVMESPIHPKDAADLIGGMLGEDDLFDSFYRQIDEGDKDARVSIALCLEDFLGNLDSFVRPWEQKAIEVCQGIVERELAFLA